MLELPPPGEEPSPEWVAKYKALPLGERLDVAVRVADRLRQETRQAFPAAAQPARAVPNELTGKLIAGEAVASELLDIAMKLDPEATLDRLDTNLEKHTPSAVQASNLMQRLMTKDN
jgi:hypothetical protein